MDKSSINGNDDENVVVSLDYEFGNHADPSEIAAAKLRHPSSQPKN